MVNSGVENRRMVVRFPEVEDLCFEGVESGFREPVRGGFEVDFRRGFSGVVFRECNGKFERWQMVEEDRSS